MKKYRVNVNGTAYEVELEEIVGGAPTTAPAPVAAPVATPVAPAPVAAAPAAGEPISCPMPGTILSVHVAVGDVVKKGTVLMILEAMKMENEIMCPCDGTVASIHATKGATMEAGALLCVIR